MPNCPLQMLALLGSATFAALGGTACTSTNSRYCDAQIACPDGRTCDLAQNRCVEQSEAECVTAADCGDPAAPLCIGGRCSQCQSSDDCSREAPRCSGEPENACVGCVDERDCAGHDGAPLCAGDGECVACASEADCSAGQACDPVERDCRPCTAPGDCESQICQVVEGACLAATQVIYVSPDGLDRPGCNVAAPCATIGFAQTYLAAGRPYIHLAAGVYRESLDLSGASAFVVAEPGAELHGAVPDRPVLRLGEGAVEIDGLTVVGNRASTSDGIQVTGGTHQLRSVVARASGASGIAVSGGQVVLDGSSAVENADDGLSIDGGRAELVRAHVSDNGGAGVLATGGEVVLEATTLANNQNGGLAARDADVELVNSLIHHNASPTFPPVYFSLLATTGTARVVHTTIVANSTGFDQTSGILCGGEYEVLVRNVIVHGNQGPMAPVSGCEITYSLLGPAIAPGTGNVLGTPRFIDLEGGDLHLVADSVGVDDGTSGDADVDMDGDPRPSGSAPDMGADEVTADGIRSPARPVFTKRKGKTR